MHDFGGTDGLKGDLSRINRIPFDGFEANTNVWGTGFSIFNTAFSSVVLSVAIASAQPPVCLLLSHRCSLMQFDVVCSYLWFSLSC